MAAKPLGVGAQLSRNVGPAPVWAWALLIAAAAYLAYRRFRTSTAGVPSPPAVGPAAPDVSTAQQPSGGAAGIPDNMPLDLVSQPDQLQQQVQAADTSNASVPTMISWGPPGGSDAFSGARFPSLAQPPGSNPVYPGNPFINPYATPTSGPGQTNPGSGAQGNPNAPVTQPYMPGGTVTGHGFVGD